MVRAEAKRGAFGALRTLEAKAWRRAVRGRKGLNVAAVAGGAFEGKALLKQGQVWRCHTCRIGGLRGRYCRVGCVVGRKVERVCWNKALL